MTDKVIKGQAETKAGCDLLAATDLKTKKKKQKPKKWQRKTKSEKQKRGKKIKCFLFLLLLFDLLGLCVPRWHFTLASAKAASSKQQ